jgi:hypothetical protein
MLIPVTGGVIVGVMHGLLEIIDQIKQSRPRQKRRFDLLAILCPTIKAIQAAVTLGTGCSLGPEGPSVDIGKSCAHGFAETMQNNRERRIALVAAGAAAGISSGTITSLRLFCPFGRLEPSFIYIQTVFHNSVQIINLECLILPSRANRIALLPQIHRHLWSS